jgi:hypothetical protein
MAGKKALFVGINKFANYPQFTLNGCVNDAKDMAALYKDLLGFKTTEMSGDHRCAGDQGQHHGQVTPMVADAKAGKLSYLVFSLSSHGTQMNDTSGDEPDGKDEAFVPYDIAEKAGAWDPAHIISDDELHDLFAQLPAGVLLEVYLDTCHSGTGLRGAEFGLHAPRARYIAPPDHEFGEKTARMRGFTLDASGPRMQRRRESPSASKAAVAGRPPPPVDGLQGQPDQRRRLFQRALQRRLHLLFRQGDARYEEQAVAQGGRRQDAGPDEIRLCANAAAGRQCHQPRRRRSSIDPLLICIRPR